MALPLVCMRREGFKALQCLGQLLRLSFPSSLQEEIKSSQTLVEVVAKWEQSQLRLTRCAPGFLKRTSSENKKQLGECVPDALDPERAICPLLGGV